MKPKFICKSTQGLALSALEHHLLTVARGWCESQFINSTRSLEDFQKKLECELAWFCYRHYYRGEPPIVIGCYDDTMLFIRSAGLSDRVVATIRLAEPDEDLAYDVQQASSAGFYTPRFLDY